MRIRDYGVRRFTESLQAQGPTAKVDDSNVLNLLSNVADSSRTWQSIALTALQKPGLTRQEQVDIVKAGLTDYEKADLIDLLDQGKIAFEPSARNLVEAVLGRATVDTNQGPLTITGTQLSGIAGIAKPGEVIEAINLSTAPAARLHLDDTMVIGTADAFGKFQGQVPDMKEGDLIRLRTRAADGSVSDWLTITAKGLGTADTRNALVNLERLDVVANTDGTVGITHNTDRPFSEPNATVRFTNTRTGEKQDIKIDDLGSIPKDLKLKGNAGDKFTVSATDGKNNTFHSVTSGTIVVPGAVDEGGVDGKQLEDPAPLAKDVLADGTHKYKTVRFTGPLFVDGVNPADVRQGAIGDCYFPAAMASIASKHPEVIEKMIKQNDDGTYTVTFQDGVKYGSQRPVEITVDGDLYAKSFGGPAYGASLGTPSQPDKMELWFPIIEKAYAQWKGSYEEIGNGGISGDVMSAVMGVKNSYTSVSQYNLDDVFARMVAGEKANHPMTAGTYGESESARYTNSGVYANHAYTVIGAEEENGVKYVKLRNPWGQSEPRGDLKDDGFFRLELSKFAELYSSFSIVQA